MKNPEASSRGLLQEPKQVLRDTVKAEQKLRNNLSKLLETSGF